MPVDLVNPDRTIHVGVILMKGETELLDVGPVDMLNAMSPKFINFLPLSEEVKKQAIDFEFHWVNEDGAEAKLTAGINLKPTDSFKTCPPLDIVIMGANTLTEIQPSEAEINYIRKSYEHCAAFLTICGGFMAPLRAGLYEGKSLTAPRFLLDMLRKSNPGVTWVERRWQRDGKMWTSGALLNGLDCMMAFVRETWGPSRGEMVEIMLNIGGWPERNVDYKEGKEASVQQFEIAV